LVTDGEVEVVEDQWMTTELLGMVAWLEEAGNSAWLMEDDGGQCGSLCEVVGWPFSTMAQIGPRGLTLPYDDPNWPLVD
jgi:hypothetical protein